MTLPSVINKSKRGIFPIVSQRMALEASLARSLAQLGLERQEKPAQDIRDYISDFARKKERLGGVEQDPAEREPADGDAA
jgi:hypothetical protein